MEDRYRLMVDLVARCCFHGGTQMGHDLMALEVEIDPLRTGSAFAATKHAGVELPRQIEIENREGEVEARAGSSHGERLAVSRTGLMRLVSRAALTTHGSGCELVLLELHAMYVRLSGLACLTLLLSACASAPGSRAGMLPVGLELETVRERRDSRFERRLDAELVRSATRVGVPRVSVLEAAINDDITAEQAALVANRAGRSLCLRLIGHFELTASNGVDSEPGDLQLHLILTELQPTSVGLAGTSALMGVLVPGPFRLPAGLGGLSAEGEALLADAPALQLRWSKGANSMLDGAQMSTIGDAYHLANDLGKDYANSLIEALADVGGRKERISPERMDRNRSLCRSAFGEASLAGRGAAWLLPLAPESIDEGAPVEDED